MAKILLVCSLPSSSIFITTSPLPEMHCVRSNAIRTLGGSPTSLLKIGLGLGWVLGLGLGLGLGLREWVPIRNIIGGAAAAHIPMTFGLSPTSCERTQWGHWVIDLVPLLYFYWTNCLLPFMLTFMLTLHLLLFISLFFIHYYFFIILLGMDPKCLLTSTDLQTRRAHCQHQLSFLLKYSEPEQNRTLITKQAKPYSNPKYRCFSHLCRIL